MAKSGDDLPSVTLLIPFRNELKNLENLSAELPKLDYPNLKIILIDDQSEDDSLVFLQEKLKSDRRVKILQSPGIGKKKAIEFGVNASDTELILCSDADCSFPKDWVRETVQPFSDPKIQLAAGPVISKGKTDIFQRFQQIEWSSILLLTQYFFTQKQPVMCSAANLAYRKSAFEAVKGYNQNWQHPSGDDEFLLKKISQHFGGECCVYLPFSENLVFTKPHATFSDLLIQRKRWAGKWKVHRDNVNALSAVFSFLIQLVWLGSVVLLGFGIWGTLVFSVVWLGKILAEKRVLGKILLGFGMKLSFFDFLWTGILHPFYVIFVAFDSIRGKFTWKGRGN